MGTEQQRQASSPLKRTTIKALPAGRYNRQIRYPDFRLRFGRADEIRLEPYGGGRWAFYQLSGVGRRLLFRLAVHDDHLRRARPTDGRHAPGRSHRAIQLHRLRLRGDFAGDGD